MLFAVDGSGLEDSCREIRVSSISSEDRLSSLELAEFSVKAAFEIFKTADYCLFINVDISWNISDNFLEAFSTIYEKYSKLSLGAFTVLNNSSEEDSSSSEIFIQTDEAIPKTCFGMTRRLYNSMKKEDKLRSLDFNSDSFMNMKSVLSFIEDEENPSSNFLS